MTVVASVLVTWFTAIVIGSASADLPQFLSEPQSAVIQPGTAVWLNCSTRPAASSIRWLLNGTQLVTTTTGSGGKRRHGSPMVEVVSGDVTSIVRIGSFNASWHEGFYQCVATTSSGILASREAKLDAAVLGSFEVSRPGQEVITAINGNVAVIPCPAIPGSRPAATIEFQFNGAILPSSSPRHTVIMPSGNLHIANVTSSDRGVYQCLAYNSVTEVRLAAPVSYRLSTSAPSSEIAPVYTSGRSMTDQLTVVLGSDMMLECSAEGWPVPQVSWEKYGGHLPAGRYTQLMGNLLIRSVQKYDAGTYLCRANNSVGQPPPARVVSVEVLEPPVVEAILASINSTEGGTVALRCRVQGSAKLTTRWLHNGSSLVAGGQSANLRDTTLTLANLQQSNSGIYQCFARNPVGSAHASIRLHVFPAMHLGIHDANKVGPTSSQDPQFDYEGEDEGGIIDVESSDRQNAASDNSNNGGERVRHGGSRNSGDAVPERSDVTLSAPSKPDVSKVSDTTALVQWTVPPSSGPHITSFRLMYKELLDDRAAVWQTVDEDIPPAWRSYEVTGLRLGRSYRFRVVAIYANSESRHSPMSSKLITDSAPAIPRSNTGPIIVEVRPLSISEIFIGWQIDAEQSQLNAIDGFFIYYAPFDDDDSVYDKQLVLGSTVRHAVLSHLKVATPYSIRMTSFSDRDSSESDFSNTVVRSTMTHAEARNAVIVPLRDDADAAIVVPQVRPNQRQSNAGGSRGHRSTTTISVVALSTLIGLADSHDAARLSTGLVPPQSDSDVEEYIGGSVAAENQLLYVVLGTVLGVVVLITVVCVAMCMWKQQQHQRSLVAIKRRKLLQHNAVVAMAAGPTAALLSSAKSPKMVTSPMLTETTMSPHGTTKTNVRPEGTQHVPNFGVGYNGETNRGSRGGSLLRDILPPGAGLYANAQTSTLSRKKVVPESSSLLVSNSANCTPSMGFTARLYNDPYCSSNPSSVAERLNCATPYSPIYSKLPGDFDYDPPASSSPNLLSSSALRLPTPQPPFPPVPQQPVISGLPQPPSLPGIASSTATGRLSPDHIPRSHERYHQVPPQLGTASSSVAARGPYWSVEPVRHAHMAGSGGRESVGGGSSSANGSASVALPRRTISSSGPDVLLPGSRTPSSHQRSGAVLPAASCYSGNGTDGETRDQGTNTDFASEAGTMSLGYSGSRGEMFDRAMHAADGDSRRDSYSDTASPGTSVVRDSFLSSDSPPPLTTPGLFFDFPDPGFRLGPVAASDDRQLHPPLTVTNYRADHGKVKSSDGLSRNQADYRL